MIDAHALFEAHLTVADVGVAIEFYQRVVGLSLAHVTANRQAAFLWIGGAGQSMLGLWVAGAAPQRVTSHVAFRVDPAAVAAAPAILQAAGVTPLDFDGRPTDQPVVIAWMPAAAVYFRDPDGHLLELLAMLPHAPSPDGGIVPWREWVRRHGAAGAA
jgi:lactoylglutathione lyase